LKAHGKINLTLDVLDLRPDGYHNIQSVMHMLSIADELEFTLTDTAEVAIDIDGPFRFGAPSDHMNLAWRAARMYLDFIQAPAIGVHIRLTKNLPALAGLGGGSSDAAHVLLGLDDLIGAKIGPMALRSLAKNLGADAPFFLGAGGAKVSGIGDIIEPLDPVDLPSFVVVMPNAAVSTARAYAALDAQPNRVSACATKRWPDGGVSNDFQPVVLDMSPEIASAADKIKAAGAHDVLLCGSGAALAGFCEDVDKTADILIQQNIGAIWRTRLVVVS
jgi:4-diphosphocytidyl-2-C-methyl-D-erythritol kinase